MASPPRRTKEDGIHARNRDYIAYDQVDKRQSYRFSEGHGGEVFDDDTEIATCDLAKFTHGDAAARSEFARELGSALSDIGFAVLEGHGIDPAIYERAELAVEELFTANSLADKMRFRAQRHGSINQGYFPIEHTSDIHPDLVEGWVFCRRAFDLTGEPSQLANHWPDPAAEQTFREVCIAQERLILPIMQSILAYLGCDPHLYDERLDRTNFAMRLNYYPPVTAEDGARGAGRLLGHEDVDLFTLLPAPRVEGLQVLNRRNFKWIRLNPPPGTIILNTGDYMQRITNDVLPSTTHRVSQPADPDARKRCRVSFPMNVYLWEDEMLEVLPGLGKPKYEPIKAVAFHTMTTAKYYGDDYAVES